MNRYTSQQDKKKEILEYIFVFYVHSSTHRELVHILKAVIPPTDGCTFLSTGRVIGIDLPPLCRWELTDLIWSMANTDSSIWSSFQHPTDDIFQIFLLKVILFSLFLRAVEGGVDVLPESVHGSRQLSIYLCDLSYWRVRKLLRWDEPRHGPLNLLGGQCVSRRHLPQHQCHTRPLIYLAGKWLYCR